MFKVKITVSSEEAGWVPQAVNTLLLKVAKDQKCPAVYELDGPNGAIARLELDDEIVEEVSLPDNIYVN